ncbi:bifunctional diaminohydroxyphosphoribosylaminopyrimidine deaminase/5-amino-6-(5-phosphoribosylamino)uracil reductase RibD [Corynebacterium uberis]|uniref:bifunctional diaminohydroxyphosphoribosylaminopyrimidine deaminase/5-amino-6-(5-phosphoribosylamino)uracil reductase RibD n=1 Tax=Corynebacterium uberis TaxID=2883169 RepID=UPI0037DDAA28
MSALPSIDLPDAFRIAVEQGHLARGTTSPNPPVGAVILDAHGRLAGVGHTQPVGGPHAEVMALRDAGERARGGSAIVTLEPCNHTGRTGPCTQALLAAGVAAVHYAHPDPTPLAGGGHRALHNAGVRVYRHADVAVTDLEPWEASMRAGRCHVTLKMAASLDGFVAAADGTSKWITGTAARAAVHRDRRLRDAIIIGTGTALADNPSLTARDEHGEVRGHQPRRVVIGSRNLPPQQCTNLHELGYEQYPDIATALQALWETGARDVLVEGGPHLAASFIEAGVVDALQIYSAPILLGAGTSVLARTVAATLRDAPHWTRTGVTPLGQDLLVEYTREPHASQKG